MKQLENSTTANFQVGDVTRASSRSRTSHTATISELARREAPHTGIAFQVGNYGPLSRKYGTNRLVIFGQQEQNAMPVL